jgi:hypothetical protein
VMDDGFEICVLCGELGFIIYSGWMKLV